MAGQITFQAQNLLCRPGRGLAGCLRHGADRLQVSASDTPTPKAVWHANHAFGETRQNRQARFIARE